ncbi:MAG: FimV/HubP family polar landmark protein [Methylococcaceae bacterium]
MRNLTKTLAVVSLLASANAYPLGIGELKLHSALNQNLNADITLVLAAGEKVADIKVSLASPDTFAAQGVPWSAFLSKIKFQPVVQANGSVVIKVSSNEVLKEPYLDLLLEVQWPKGNLYREFTVLVDPPSVYKQASVPLAVAEEVTPAPVKALVTPPVVPVAKAVISEPKTVANKPVVAAEKVAPTPPAEKLPTPTNGGNQYGPTRPKETLWSIAAQTKDNDATVTQMAVAIFAQNPEAFRKGNVNRLIPERTLQIPDKSVVLRLSPAQASADFRQYSKGRKSHPVPVAIEEDNTAPTRQHTTLNAKHKQTNNTPAETASVKPEVSVPAEKPTVENQLKLIAPSEAVVPDNAIVTSGKANDTQAKGKSGKKSAKEPDMSAADRALQAKLVELEQQLNTMQKVLALKDQQLSALQNQAHINETATTNKVATEVKPIATTPAPAVVAAKPEATPAKPVVSAELKPTIATPPAPAVVAAKPEATPAKPVVSTELKPTKATPPAPAVVAAKPETPPAQKIEKKPTAVKAPVVVPVEENAGIESYLLAGAGGTVLLGLIGFFWWRKRKIDAELENDPYSAHQTEASKAAIKNKVSNKSSAAATSAAIPEDSIGFDTNNLAGLSDFAPSDFDIFNPSDFDTFDTNQDEIDPVSEADVYLAYGRYQQAEELMRDAIKEQPHRDECKLKLLEIFYSNENKQAFAEYARELAESGKAEDSVFWAKVMEMGSELCPNIDLFTEEGLSKIIKAAPVSSANKSSALNAENDLGLMSFDSSFEDLFGGEPSAQAQDSQSSKISPTSFEDSFADFDFSSFDQENTEEELTVAAEIGEETHAFEDSFADFDLNGFGDQEPHDDEAPESFAISETTAKALDNAADDIESVSFDELLEQPSAKPVEVTKVAEEIESVEFDFDGLLEQPSGKPAEVAKAAEEIESVEFDFDGLLEQPSAKPAEVAIAAEEIESVEFDFDGLLEQPSAKPAEVAIAAEEIESVEFDFDGLLEQSSAKPAEVAKAIEENEFDFGEFEAATKQAKVELTKETPVNEFDFSEFEQKPLAETKAGKFDFDELLNPVEDNTVIDSHEEIDEFDFSAFENKTAKAEIIDTPINEFDFSEFENETAKTETVDTPVNEFDFSEFADLKAEPPKNVEPTNKEKAATVDHDENDYASVDFDFDFDMPIGRKATNQKGSVEFTELTEMDEIEIKLDLARAYIDMDDTDSAKSIVREVLEKGTDEQKMVAQAIMDYLA